MLKCGCPIPELESTIETYKSQLAAADVLIREAEANDWETSHIVTAKAGIRKLLAANQRLLKAEIKRHKSFCLDQGLGLSFWDEHIKRRKAVSGLPITSQTNWRGSAFEGIV